MTKCPYCGKLCNPIKFLTYSRWSPYCCASCGKRSRLGRLAIVVVVLPPVLLADYLVRIGYLSKVPAVLVGCLLAIGLMCCLKLYPMEDR